MKYTIEELKYLRNIRAVDFDDYNDSGQTNVKLDFIYYSDEFFKWLDKMEKINKIKDMLATMNISNVK